MQPGNAPGLCDARSCGATPGTLAATRSMAQSSAAPRAGSTAAAAPGHASQKGRRLPGWKTPASGRLCCKTRCATGMAAESRKFFYRIQNLAVRPASPALTKTSFSVLSGGRTPTDFFNTIGPYRTLRARLVSATLEEGKDCLGHVLMDGPACFRRNAAKR